MSMTSRDVCFLVSAMDKKGRQITQQSVQDALSWEQSKKQVKIPERSEDGQGFQAGTKSRRYAPGACRPPITIVGGKGLPRAPRSSLAPAHE